MSRQVIIAAINRQEIDAEHIGGRYAENTKFINWKLSDRHQLLFGGRNEDQGPILLLAV